MPASIGLLYSDRPVMLDSGCYDGLRNPKKSDAHAVIRQLVRFKPDVVSNDDCDSPPASGIQ